MSEFGLRITTPEEKKEVLERQKRFIPPESDGSALIQFGGYYGYYLDQDGTPKTDSDLILKYREMSYHPEVDKAIEDIVNEAIVFEENGDCIELNLDKIEDLQPATKDRIIKEFKRILELLDFKNKAYDIFKNWYVDGRLYYHVVLDSDQPRDGIKGLDWIDSRKIKKVRQINKKLDQKTGVNIIEKIEEYFVYSENSATVPNYNVTNSAQTSVKIAPDAIVYVPSGLLNGSKTQTVSYLHKGIKPLNQLRMVEDAMVLYRLARAPERRLFYVDIGTMSTQKAQQYIKSLQDNYRNKLVYDAQTGEIRDDRKFMSVLEDFWLPRREGGRGTEVSTLPGGQNLGDIEDVKFFLQKLYRALNVPIGRFEPQTGFSIGRSTEITRDEIAFSKFIKKLRLKFTKLFNDLLEKQLILKGIVTSYEWTKYKNDLWYKFVEDVSFDELRDNELFRDRLDMLGMTNQYQGIYFSKEWIYKNILKFTDKEIIEMKNQMKREPPPWNAGGMGGGMMPPMGGGSPFGGGGLPQNSNFTGNDENGTEQQGFDNQQNSGFDQQRQFGQGQG